MVELSSLKKNKVNLSDYDCQQDIESRILMSDFSMLDIEVLEEIIYSPLKIPKNKLKKNLDCSDLDLEISLEKLQKAGLLTEIDETIKVDKEKRKYFEFEIQRFDSSFKPDMEFLQGLLRKVPIHILPTWYSIPRTSNNIFESIVEKYLLTPHIYQRYLSEQNFNNPVIGSIINDLTMSEELRLSSTDLISKYNLKRTEFEEIMLLLEFNFIACVIYEMQDDHWVEFVSVFHEWGEFVKFKKHTEAKPIKDIEKIEKDSLSPFDFIEKMTQILEKAPITIDKATPEIQKLSLLKLARVSNNLLNCSESGQVWLEMDPENRSLFLYRHPQNRVLSLDIPERYIREAEKSIKRVLDGKWVYFDDFIKGVLIPLNEDSVISLRKVGRHWSYQLPNYSEKEVQILEATIFEWLYELGIVSTGTLNERKCFCVTEFGKFFFSG